jgi:hypothetical protein
MQSKEVGVIDMKKLTVENRLIRNNEIINMDSMPNNDLIQIGKLLNHVALTIAGYEKKSKASA